MPRRDDWVGNSEAVELRPQLDEVSWSVYRKSNLCKSWLIYVFG